MQKMQYLMQDNLNGVFETAINTGIYIFIYKGEWMRGEGGINLFLFKMKFLNVAKGKVKL